MAVAMEPLQPTHNQWRLRSTQYIGEISALSLLSVPHHRLPYLLAGSGSQLFLYDLELGNMISSFPVFHAIRVHGISSSPFHSLSIAVFGETRLKLFTLLIDPDNNNGPHLTLSHSLPKFNSWVLDVCFFKPKKSTFHGVSDYLAVGLSDNSVRVWDILNSTVVLQVQSPERSLLYSMRLWGDSLEALRIASGTIYNEIIIWKVVPQDNSLSNSLEQHDQTYNAVHTRKLVGHEGSIFRLAWSTNGSKLVSVSDDRSARVWEIFSGTEDSDKLSESVGLVLFGHTARVWDCCIFDSLIVTAGEDCTCRVWGLDGKQLNMIKEHIGRGIWRCLYDPDFSLLITAGFDSSIKVHQLGNTSHSGSFAGHSEAKASNEKNIYTTRIPNLLDHIGLTDSKSEYVRCLRFRDENTLYVTTNHGYLYHAKLSHTRDVTWTEIVQAGEKLPIVCMDLLSKAFNPCCADEDWIAVGDGKGNMTVVRVINKACSPKVDITITWAAEQERQLLGTHWCKPLGCSYIFTADPRGTLKLWRLYDDFQSFPHNSTDCSSVSLVAEFTSSFGLRIMCLDTSIEDEVLVCGDIRGNLVLFPLLRSLLVGTDTPSHTKVSALNSFKGAHGISSVTSVAVVRLHANQIEIRSTGGDGCICYLEYDRDGHHLEFTGMKQVKELSLIQSVRADTNSVNELSNAHYAAGFTSVDFMIWNIKTETKILQIPCGGWRRPHSYYVGDLPEVNNCFAYVKDEVIHIHRHCLPESCRKIYPQNLHMQFHGREMHSLCFVTQELLPVTNAKNSHFSGSSWIATGCEDGTVRLTRYSPSLENWTESKLLGEHVGGSAVRSICSVSKVHLISADVTNIPDGISVQSASREDKESPFLLISVGAKRVLTSWLLKNSKVYQMEETLAGEHHLKTENGSLLEEPSSMSFQWLSTDMPPKYSSTNKFRRNTTKMIGVGDNTSSTSNDDDREGGMLHLKSCLTERCEDDWRYMAVTAFLVKCVGSRLTICFVVIACSDATLVLRALVLPLRLWFDVAFLVPLSSPVLALKHVVVSTRLSSTENVQDQNVYIVISGATDGSITLWDLTGSVEAFMRRVSVLQVEKFIDCQKRPRTGRGSQGGRWWRSLGSSLSKSKTGMEPVSVTTGAASSHELVNPGTPLSVENHSGSSITASTQAIPVASRLSEFYADDSSSEICEIRPIYVLEHVHQSGVNCLHVSDVKGYQSSDGGFNVLSGGDDQAIHCLRFALTSVRQEGETRTQQNAESVNGLGNENNFVQSSRSDCDIRFLNHDRVLSAHTSAVKGIWTDGSWVFSTGLDQRIRCWRLDERGALTEYGYAIISVPEPEALDARACSRGCYQIVVAGRGMQMAEFSAPVKQCLSNSTVETKRCKYWVPKKNRFCANSPVDDSPFCGNHKPRPQEQWTPCPIDPSHSVLRENLESHVKRCPLLKQVQSLALHPFYQKGINSGEEDDETVGPAANVKKLALPSSNKLGSGRSLDHVSSESKRNSVYSLSVDEFCKLIEKIKSIHESICDGIRDSHKNPEACGIWIKREVDGKLPFQEKHVAQQASILGNLEEFGVLNRDCSGSERCKRDVVPAVVEFGAGRGYLTQMLADCYGVGKVLLVERKAYKLKADRSLRQKERLTLERLRIDIEDLNLNAVDSLRGVPYLAIGKHLCGPATDMTLRCCIMEDCKEEKASDFCSKLNLRGLAIATCCHHLCQWKNYINKKFFSNMGITKEEFHMITWFTSWAVDADHGSNLTDVSSCRLHPHSIDPKIGVNSGVEDIVRNMEAVERGSVGFMCKQIIDMGRMIWMKERGLRSQFVKYVPPSISPENHLLIAGAGSGIN